jgi:hypothetical protein
MYERIKVKGCEVTLELDDSSLAAVKGATLTTSTTPQGLKLLWSPPVSLLAAARTKDPVKYRMKNLGKSIIADKI